jgi:tryptophan synthase alpha chain
MGVTGTHARPHDALRGRLGELRKATDKPLAVGIGVSTPEDVAHISPYADGVIVGSALIQAARDRDPVAAVEEASTALSRARRPLI